MKYTEKEIQKLNIQQLLDQGYSTEQISKTLMISVGTVVNRKKEIAQSATNGAIIQQTAQNVINHEIRPLEQITMLNEKVLYVWETAVEPGEIFACNEQLLKQLKLYTDMVKELYNVQRVEVFMTTVMETMDETSPELRSEFMRRINNKSAMGGVRFEL